MKSEQASEVCIALLRAVQGRMGDVRTENHMIKDKGVRTVWSAVV